MASIKNEVKGIVERFHESDVEAGMEVSLSIRHDGVTDTYELSAFTTQFVQEIDNKGEPSSSKRGDLFAFSLLQPANRFLNHWMLGLEKPAYEGEFVFRHPGASASPALTIRFKGAVCISFQKDISPSGGGVMLRMIIAAEEIKYDDVDFDNGDWVNSSLYPKKQ
jgi:hypothetical protein